MSGRGKRKCKKKHEIPSNSVADPNEKQRKLPINVKSDEMDVDLLEMQLYDMVEQQYQQVMNILLCLEFSNEVALMGILNHGSIRGTSINILDNILRNSIFYLATGYVVDPAFSRGGDAKPTFKEMKDVVHYSVQTMINAITKKDRTKADAIKYILSAMYAAEDEKCRDSNLVQNEGEWQLKKTNEVLTRLMRNDPKKVMSYWKHPPEKEDHQIMELADEVASLSVKLKIRKDWAEVTVIQAARKLNNDRMELRQLRSEKEGLYFKTEKNSDYAAILAEQKDKFEKMNYEIAQIKLKSRNTETCNNSLKSGISAITLVASEDESALRLLRKKEKRRQKIQSDREKQESELKKQIEEWKHKNDQLDANLLQTGESEKQAKLMLRQETEAKKQARFLFQEVERLEKKAKEESMRLLAHKSNSKSGGGVAASPPGSDSCSKQRLCLICNTKRSNILFLPCTDLVTCEDCNRNSLSNLKDGCLLCNGRIEKKIKVYMSE